MIETDNMLVVKDFKITTKNVAHLTDEKLIALAKAHVLEEEGGVSRKVIKVGKNRIQNIAGQYSIDFILEDEHGNVLEVNKARATVRRSRKNLALALIASLLILLSLLGGLWYMSNQKHVPVSSGLPAAVTEKLSDAELKKYANKKVDESNVTLRVYPKIEIEKDGLTGTIFAQNLPVNKTGQTITLIDVQTGAELFVSGLIKPGYQLSSIKMNKKLSQGTHKGLIRVTFYDLKEEKKVGQTDVEVSIKVA